MLRYIQNWQVGRDSSENSEDRGLLLSPALAGQQGIDMPFTVKLIDGWWHWVIQDPAFTSAVGYPSKGICIQVATEVFGHVYVGE